MLPARHRLRSSADFRDTVRRGRRSGGRALVLHLLAAPAAVRDVPMPGAMPGAVLDAMPEPVPGGAPVPDAPARVGFVVSRAVGPAVTRNLVKRRLRHLLRERLGRLPRGSLLVVRALPAAAGTSYAELAADLDRRLDRLLGRVAA